MEYRRLYVLIFSLVSCGSLSASAPSEYGLLLLKDYEYLHLETCVPKVVAVHLNPLGAQRSGEVASNEQEEFTTIDASSSEALQQLPLHMILPTSVNNSLLPAFPPIGDQGQMRSCVAWGSAYYQASHEIALLNGFSNKNGMQGVLSPKWTYDILNGGVDGGLSVLDAYRLLSISGGTSIINFPYDSHYTVWELPSQGWVSAINNRMAPYALIPGLGGAQAQNLTVIKAALANGHVLTFATFIDSWVFTQIKPDPEILENRNDGQLAVTYMNGTSGGHFMTIVGYDDNLWIDVNGNGQVDVGERGAFLVANSWGDSWGNLGFIWISYDAFLAQSAVCGGPNTGRLPAGIALNSNVITALPKAKNYSPSLISQFSVVQGDRNQIAIQAGVSSLNQSAQEIGGFDNGLPPTLQFRRPNLGATQDLSFALDLTDFLPSTTGGTVQRYYLSITDDVAGTSARLHSYSLIDLVYNKQINYLPQNCDEISGLIFLDYNFSEAIPNVTQEKDQIY